MQSPFVQSLLDQLRTSQENNLKSLEVAISSAASGQACSEEDQLMASQLIFAVKVIAAVADGMAPWVADGPTDLDKDWAEAYYKARKAKEVRPEHFDPKIEELLQHVTV
jgi:hypothetical protein